MSLKLRQSVARFSPGKVAWVKRMRLLDVNVLALLVLVIILSATGGVSLIA